MTDVPRVTVTPRVVDAQEFAAIISLVQLGRVPEAWARFQSASLGDGALARFGGAVNAALAAAEQPQQPALPPPTGRIDFSIPFGDGKRREIPTIAGEVVHIAFGFPAGATPFAHDGHIGWYEFGGPPKTRIVSITREPGDPGAADQSRALVTAGGKASHVAINVGAAEGVSYGGVVSLLAGQTYYFNLRNFTSLDESQPMAIEIIWPN